MAAGAGLTGSRPHAGQSGRRRGPGRQADHRGRSAHLPRWVRLPVRLLAAGGRTVVLIARVSGRPLPEFRAERLFEPLGMADIGFAVPAGKLDRFTSYYRTDPAGGLELVDAPDGQWSSLPVFPSGAGGLVSTVDDWHSFARMLLAGGSVERAGTLRLGRRHRNHSAHHPVHRRGHHPAQPAGNGRTDPARPDAGLLAAHGERLKPGIGAASAASAILPHHGQWAKPQVTASAWRSGAVPGIARPPDPEPAQLPVWGRRL